MKLLLLHSAMDAMRWLDRAHMADTDVLCISATEHNIREVVTALAKADALIVPDELERCDKTVERIKTIARQMEIAVMPRMVWANRQANTNPPATVLAEPRSQQGAVRGHNPSTPCASS